VGILGLAFLSPIHTPEPSVSRVPWLRACPVRSTTLITAELADAIHGGCESERQPC
jgi:hypothetical protein